MLDVVMLDVVMLDLVLVVLDVAPKPPRVQRTLERGPQARFLAPDTLAK